MAGGFFKNVGVDVRQLIEESFPEEYKFKFVFLDEAFKYRYVRCVLFSIRWKEKKPVVIKVFSQNLEHIMDDYYSDDVKV